MAIAAYRCVMSRGDSVSRTYSRRDMKERGGGKERGVVLGADIQMDRNECGYWTSVEQ